MKIKFDISSQTNFILGLFLIHFVFFGFICNIYKKNIGFDLIFLYRVIFFPASISYFSVFILMFIVFIITIREHFYEYAIRNSLWLVPFIILFSWIWYWIIYGFDITIIVLFFINIEGYITILTFIGITLLTSIFASYLKFKYKKFTGQITI
ncbi:MAG: hypothetical protein EU549_04435 [Promethearchaeota archaeon]|nr:MAG: hypothetical protein EU549_04435 [Candidatus Lokiarchaeota archaeon]